MHTDAIQGVKVPAWNQYNPYDPERDPLLKEGPEPSAPRAVYYYHADHLGTPQVLWGGGDLRLICITKPLTT